MQSRCEGLKWGFYSSFDWLTACVGEVGSPPRDLGFVSVPQEVILYFTVLWCLLLWSNKWSRMRTELVSVSTGPNTSLGVFGFSYCHCCQVNSLQFSWATQGPLFISCQIGSNSGVSSWDFRTGSTESHQESERGERERERKVREKERERETWTEQSWDFRKQTSVRPTGGTESHQEREREESEREREGREREKERGERERGLEREREGEREGGERERE